jgi:hypothetical protein
VLPLSWELVEICRVLPSAAVAVIVTELALVVCQVNVTVWPEVMLVLLAEKTSVGADVVRELADVEPQLVKAISGAIAANQSRIFEHVAREPILPRIDNEICRRRLFLRILLLPFIVAACNASLLRGASGKDNIPTRVTRHLPHRSLFPDKRQPGQAMQPKPYRVVHGCQYLYSDRTDADTMSYRCSVSRDAWQRNSNLRL